MSDLERDTARTIRRWLSRPNERLTKAGTGHLRRWMTKNAIVLSFAGNGSRRFFDDPTETAIPDIATALAIAEGQIPDGVVVGAARTDGKSPQLWGVGNPTVVPSGPDRISTRAVNVAAVNLGHLQLWVATPIAQPDALRLPKGVALLHPQLKSAAMRSRSGSLDPEQVTAVFSDETTAAIAAELSAEI